MALKVRIGGAGEDVLLLLHGLGATGDVWRDVDAHWQGRWLAPDLPGHGGSDRLEKYTFESMAGELRGLIGPHDRVTVLGHSLGGVLAVLLGQMEQVDHVVGLGIKVVWSPDELARAGALAERHAAWFDTRADALAWHRKVSGPVSRTRACATSVRTTGASRSRETWAPFSPRPRSSPFSTRTTSGCPTSSDSS